MRSAPSSAFGSRRIENVCESVIRRVRSMRTASDMLLRSTPIPESRFTGVKYRSAAHNGIVKIAAAAKTARMTDETGEYCITFLLPLFSEPKRITIRERPREHSAYGIVDPRLEPTHIEVVAAGPANVSQSCPRADLE